MIRIISLAVGAFFSLALLLAFGTGAYNYISEPPAKTVEAAFHEHPKHLSLSSDGWFGKFDKQQLQRGFQVYDQVCKNCHSIKHVAFRDLAALGYSEAEVKAIAATYTVAGKDPLTGEVKDRPGVAADKFPLVAYAGAGTPPDLSLITKARHNGPAYVYSLLTGYQNQPAELLKKFPEAKTPDGLFYNPYFANLNLAMPAPLADGQVTYADGTKATVEQMAHDVAAFLMWTAEPKLEERKRMGLKVMIFLVVLTGLFLAAKKRIWKDLH